MRFDKQKDTNGYTLSPLLKKLEADKLVARVRGTTDGRMVRVVLTARGRSLRRSLMRMQSDLACRLGLVPTSVVRLRKQLWMLLQDLIKASSDMDEADSFEYGHRSRRLGGASALRRRGAARSTSSEGVWWSRQGWRNKS